ncbi:MAG TPA: hypothetical protein VGI88_03440 [Verrucomicrobiae bacterium]
MKQFRCGDSGNYGLFLSELMQKAGHVKPSALVSDKNGTVKN